MSRSIKEKRADFQALHEQGCFVIPQSVGRRQREDARVDGIQGARDDELGFSCTQGKADSHVSRDDVLAHLRMIVAATDLPVNADFEAGYASTPQGVAQSVRLAIDTGVAGLRSRTRLTTRRSLRPIDEAVSRLRAARAAIDESRTGVMLVGRAENFISNRPDLDDTIAHLKAYSEAGADCLYAPGIRTKEQIAPS